MKILIVDDEFVSRKKAQKIMSRYGDCDTAADGSEAVEAFELAHKEGEPYDLITLDILMPEIDGIETLRRIRKSEAEFGAADDNRVKVVMLTASTSKESVYPSFREGCEAYVIKPFDRDKLSGALSKLGLVAPSHNE